MKCNLIVSIDEVTVRDYTRIEEKGILSIVAQRSGLSFEYEDEEKGKQVLVIRGKSRKSILSFLDAAEMPVVIIT